MMSAQRCAHRSSVTASSATREPATPILVSIRANSVAAASRAPDREKSPSFRKDMYGRDQVLIAILRGEERKIAESPVDRREGYSGRAAAVTPPGYYQGGYYQGGYQNNGGNLFSRLFGGGFGDGQPVPRQRAPQGRQSWDFQ
jgi:hypothetical protein